MDSYDVIRCAQVLRKYEEGERHGEIACIPRADVDIIARASTPYSLTVLLQPHEGPRFCVTIVYIPPASSRYLP